jgi:hypothetical protein
MEKRGGLSLHDVKHVISNTVDGLVAWMSEGIEAFESTCGFSFGPEERFREFLLSLACTGLKELIPSREEAKAYTKNLLNDFKENQDQLKSYLDQFPEVREKLSLTPVRSKRKERGLYVDIDGQGNIHNPSSLHDNHARDEIFDLEWFLETFDLLPKALEDDNHWRSLTQRIRSKITARDHNREGKA